MKKECIIYSDKKEPNFKVAIIDDPDPDGWGHEKIEYLKKKCLLEQAGNILSMDAIIWPPKDLDDVLQSSDVTLPNGSDAS